MVPAMIRPPYLPALFCLALSAATPAVAATGAWGEGQRAEARLIAAGVDGSGRLEAGVEIRLPEGWHTYWRDPGDAGVVPEIDFSGSDNLGAATVDFPVPERLDDGFAVTNVYDGSVILPVRASVSDPAKPVDLVARLVVGACAEICVRDEIEARVTIAPGARDAAAAGVLAAAAAAVPGAAEPGVFFLDGLARTGGTDGRPEFRVTGVVPDAGNATLFAEGPQGWAAYTPDFAGAEDGKDVWTVKFDRLGATTPIAGAAIRFTVASDGRAIDQTLVLE